MKTIGITLIVAILLGLGYGRISAVLNQNPYYPVFGQYNVPEEDMAEAWRWQPSPIWLPSDLLCKIPTNGYGISHTRSGDLFRSKANRKKYSIANTILGAVLGGFAGCIVLVITRKKESVEPGVQGDAVNPAP